MSALVQLHLAKQALPAAIVAFVLIVATPVDASSDRLLHMRCTWRKVTDMKTFKTEPVSGTADFFYDPISDLTGTMMKDGFIHPFVAGTRDNLIEGAAHYQEEGAPAEQRVEINRRSGAIMYLMKTPKETRVLEGVCVRISGPDFGQEIGPQ